MNSKLLTPRRILLVLGIIAFIFLGRECLKNRGNDNKSPDQVCVRYDSAPTNLNPYTTAVASDLFTCARIFQTLGEADPKTLELLPVIIKNIPQARTVQEGPHAGQLAYDFELIPEAAWDNGTPMTGNDIAFTLKIIFHPTLQSLYLPYFKDVTGFEVDPNNPKKFTFFFSHYYILAVESMCQVAIMPAYNYDPANRLVNTPIADFIDSTKRAALKEDPGMKAFAQEFQQAKFASDPNGIVGSGPYRLETMNDQGAILARKQNWWADKMANPSLFLNAYPKKLVYKVVKDENVVEIMLKNGELDIVGNSFNAGKFLELKQKDSLAARYNFDVLPALSYNRWLLNLTKPILKDIRVRKALAHIVDYDHFIKNIRSNMAIRTVSPILPTKRYYAKDLVMYDFNIQKAKDLLAQAGWSDANGDGILDKTVDGQNVKLTLELLVPATRANQQYAESISETARLAGIEIKTVTTDLSEISAKTKSGDYESAFLGTAVFSGLSELSQRYHSKYLAPVGDNRSRYVNPVLDALLDQIGKESNEAKRDALYVQAQTILYDELPEIFLFAPMQPIITAKKFDGVTTANRPGYFEQLFKLKSAN